jgi:dipeptidyl aminopeptidase/acylaminoacyl peptidase
MRRFFRAFAALLTLPPERPPVFLVGVLLLVGALLLGPVATRAQGQQQEKLPIQATDLFKIRQIEDVAVSPGGRSVVYTVKRALQRPDSAGGPTYRTHLWRVDAGGRSEPQQLTFGERSAHSPAWHPSGSSLAFVRADDSGTPQVFVLPTAGGEAYQLTDAKHGAAAPAFSPGGEQLLFASRLPEKALRKATGEAPQWASERPGRYPGDAAGATPDPDGSLDEVRAYLAEERSGVPSVINRLDFQGERGLEPTRSYRHLFVLDVTARDAPPPGDLPEATRITGGFRNFGGGSWHPDGNHVAVSAAPVATDENPDRVRDRDLYLAGTGGPGQTRLLSMNGHALSAPRFSPGGARVAFSATARADSGYAQGEIGLYRTNRPAAEARLLTEGFDRSAGSPQWASNGWTLYATAPSEGAFPLYRLAPFAGAQQQRTRLRRRQQQRTDSLAALPAGSTRVAPPASDARVADTSATDTTATDTTAADTTATPTIERLTGPRRGIRAFDVGRSSLFYVVTRPENPFELYANSADFTRERRLTKHNAAWLVDRRLSMPEPFTVQSDTFAIDGWTMQPTTQRHGTPAPLLVQIHGGPMAMWGPGEATMWHEFQYFAAQGYALVYSNPRGSGGYGQAFKKANYRDWGRGPTRDVLAAADYAASLDWTDPERQVVTGGSYAGYLTAWIVAHTDRFEAAAAQRGVYDLATFLGEGNAWRLVPYHFGGFPWEGDEDAPAAGNAPVIAEGGLEGSGAADPGTGAAPDTTAAPTDTLAQGLQFASARAALIQNSPLTYVDQIRTPLLIMHASEDLRTGVSQSAMLYRSLKVLGRPVEYVRYPDAGHDLSRTGAPAQRLDRVLRIWAFFERYI